MAQKREQDETLDLQVPTDTPHEATNTTTTTKSGCGSIAPRIDRRDTSAGEVPYPTEGRKRTATDEGCEPEAAKRAVNRCSGCRKRVGLTGFRCRCGDLFCWEHRYSDRHDCSYDYKTAGRAAIARENPLVRAPKILKV